MSDNESSQNLRTPLQLAIRVITTHAFALANYVYVSNLLRRPMRTHMQALRLALFAFVPTLPLVELLTSAVRSFLQFIQNYEDDDDIHLRYYLSGALGMQATLSQDDDNKEASKDASKNQHLLTVGSHAAEKHVAPLDWVWVGKLLASLFALTQAVGSIVIYARRLNMGDSDALAFDHRNGAMGIASAILTTIAILIIFLRLNWKVSKTFEAPSKGYYVHPRSQFIVEALLSMFLHLIIATIPNRDNRWMYTSVGSIAWLFVGGRKNVRGFVVLQGLQSIFLFLFAYFFRHEIVRRLGLEDRIQVWYTQFLGDKRWKRVKAVLVFLLVAWILTDIVRLFVVDILQVLKENGRRYGWPGYWWQDPISDSLIVI